MPKGTTKGAPPPKGSILEFTPHSEYWNKPYPRTGIVISDGIVEDGRIRILWEDGRITLADGWAAMKVIA